MEINKQFRVFYFMRLFFFLFCTNHGLQQNLAFVLCLCVWGGEGSEKRWDFRSQLMQKILDGIRKRRLSYYAS